MWFLLFLYLKGLRLKDLSFCVSQSIRQISVLYLHLSETVLNPRNAAFLEAQLCTERIPKCGNWAGNKSSKAWYAEMRKVNREISEVFSWAAAAQTSMKSKPANGEGLSYSSWHGPEGTWHARWRRWHLLTSCIPAESPVDCSTRSVKKLQCPTGLPVLP